MGYYNFLKDKKYVMTIYHPVLQLNYIETNHYNLNVNEMGNVPTLPYTIKFGVDGFTFQICLQNFKCNFRSKLIGCGPILHIHKT